MKSRYITIITALLSLGLVTGCLNIRVNCDCKHKHHEGEEHEGKESDEGEEKEEMENKHHHEAEKDDEDEKEEKKSPEDLKAKAKLTEDQARKIALAKVPNGTIKEGELERENGYIQWSFDIATPGTRNITEVNIDAISGKILDISQETPAEQEKEREAEKKEKEGKEKE